MMKTLKSGVAKTVLLLTVAAVMFVLSGCETWKGVGKDVEKGGQAIQGEEAPK